MSPREARMHRRLGLIGGGPQSHYEDILRIVKGEVAMRSASNLAGHLLRELESALRDALEPITGHQAAKAATPPKNGQGHEFEIKAILRVMGVSETSGLGASWLDYATGDAPPPKVAHRRQFSPPPPLDAEFSQLWATFEPVLEAVLEWFESRYGEITNAVDLLLAKPLPTTSDLKVLGAHLPNHPVVRFRFFDELLHPGWLAPLAKSGYLNRPPAAVRDESTGTTSFPWWPAASYLARMAKVPECQETITGLLLDLPDTDNFAVVDGVVAILKALPAEQAAKVVPRLIGMYANVPPIGLLAKTVSELALDLAKAGYRQQSLELMKTVLNFTRGRPHGSSGALEDYGYEQAIEKHVPEMLALAPEETFTLLLDLLQEALSVASDDTHPETSHSWRRSIEQANRGRRYVLADALIDGVRDAAISRCEDEPSRVPEIVARLEAVPHPIGVRLAWFVLTKARKAQISLAQERLLNREALDQWRAHPEYGPLLAASFQHLEKSAQETILGWILEGPSQQPSIEGAKLDAWRYRRLSELKGHLPEEWEAELSRITPDASQEQTQDGVVWRGPTSPVTAAELGVKSVDEVLEFARSWQAGTGWREPSTEGLGRVLTLVVADRPAEFALVAQRIVEQRPTFVRAILQGLLDALKTTRSFEWEAVNKVCAWVVAQPDEPTGDNPSWDHDPDWSWSRQTVARLVTAGLDSTTNTLPVSLRSDVWSIIEALSWDPDPSTPDETPTDLESGLDQAINTVRGNAVAAAVRYGVWLKKTGAVTDAKAMQSMPELAASLEQHADPSRETSVAIRAVLGECIPVLHWIDSEWATPYSQRLVAADGILGLAAWTSYLKWNDLYDRVFESLKAQYVVAVAEPGLHVSKVAAGTSIQHLIQHLTVVHLRGLPGAAELIESFLAVASEASRAEAVEFVGRSLISPGPLAEGEAERAVDLWDRLLSARSAQDTGVPLELEPFGWWLCSHKLDLEWSIRNALVVLGFGAVLEPDHLVLDYLKTLALTRPLEAVRLLNGICDNIRNEWSIHGWLDAATTVLETCINSDSAAAQVGARAAASKLIARGHPRFGRFV
jgi:hypothetical protein